MLRRTMRGSFCNRADAEVAKLVAGPLRLFGGRVYICDRCATQTIQAGQNVTRHDTRRAAARRAGLPIRYVHRRPERVPASGFPRPRSTHEDG
jgi:hypothetical protein